MDHHRGARQEGGLDRVQGVGRKEGRGEGEDELLGKPESCVHLLPQRLGHNADPEIGGEHLGRSSFPVHHRDVKLTTAHPAAVKFKTVEKTLESLRQVLHLLESSKNFLKCSRLFLVGKKVCSNAATHHVRTVQPGHSFVEGSHCGGGQELANLASGHQ